MHILTYQFKIMLSEALSCLRFYSYNAVVKLVGSLSSNTIIIINESNKY